MNFFAYDHVPWFYTVRLIDWVIEREDKVKKRLRTTVTDIWQRPFQEKRHFYSSINLWILKIKACTVDRDINAFFSLKTVVKFKKNINLGMFSSMHTTFRKSFEKVICPFMKLFGPCMRELLRILLGYSLHNNVAIKNLGIRSRLQWG